MLLRLLLFLVFLYLFLLLLRLFFSWRRGGSKLRGRDVTAPLEDMVLDPQCHTYLPKGEAVLRDGNYFCSERCATLFLSR
ncbi:MAG: hypothetical protein ACREP8_00785 [Candidatus Binatia bacterium]